ncbi:DUF3145 domain-containing protein [Brooklawnia cerclae]|uniref:DUF3145 domain-containing protein n=1 Tax=Brooklawnia cerclae TaxID=349934 RepID=A0ABX0SCV9_9ACTN|nr:DUF3145 domain-containing protein [Brooklawnia cerclae]NIH56222.1 hypothetical protein [Brooklawnia cerclae]
MGNMSRGVVFVHSTPAALCPHLEWGVGAVLGVPVHFDWTHQPAQPGTLRAEYSWAGPVGASAALASALRSCQRARFEVTEDAVGSELGQRYAFTPDLGMFHAIAGPNGDLQIPEQRLRAAMGAADAGSTTLEQALSDLLGERWDAELEVFRYAGEDAPVRWLHRVG